MVVLGIDPGYAIVGYGIVKYESNKFTPIEYGAITTAAKTDFSSRLEKIYDEMLMLLSKHLLDAVSIEKLFFNTNTTTAIDVAQARGVIVLAAQKMKVPVFEYTPLQVKQAVTGYGRAEKKQIMEMTRILLNLEKVPKPDDTADALAMAICHAHSAGSLLGKIYAGGNR
ncbi:MAG: crossover junction endodeoxyribonuclease RuvC [Oscillospiraceae bacterium]|nr:crossover junction endodeoxyribonuclease RuvC [Oscillospiraceae bacterium]